MYKRVHYNLKNINTFPDYLDNIYISKHFSAIVVNFNRNLKRILSLSMILLLSILLVLQRLGTCE
jgi:predicted transcriptional regulator